MANIWNIPDWLEEEVRSRDRCCVYCGIELKEYPQAKGTPGDKATFEHIDNDGLPTKENIAMCCASCNSSKGAKDLLEWFKTPFCRERGIGEETVAPVIREYIKRHYK
ncbi:MAG: HNH endonuclease signature motif containing protein [bacterium]|nr:HNH endonuclease signature motif containing protein [bacterium]